MKSISEIILKNDVRYAPDHEWARREGDAVTVGVSDYAQEQLGDIVFVELPAVKRRFKKGESFGSVESTKAVSELFMPVSGEISAVNAGLAENPEWINSDPYGNGWIIRVKPSDPAEFDGLMDETAYRTYLTGGIP